MSIVFSISPLNLTDVQQISKEHRVSSERVHTYPVCHNNRNTRNDSDTHTCAYQCRWRRSKRSTVKVFLLVGWDWNGVQCFQLLRTPFWTCLYWVICYCCTFFTLIVLWWSTEIEIKSEHQLLLSRFRVRGTWPSGQGHFVLQWGPQVGFFSI